MTMQSLSTHARMAVLARFAPVEILEDTATPSPGGYPDQHRLHFWGYMDGVQVDILVQVGGVFTAPRVQAASLEPPGNATLNQSCIKRELAGLLGVDENVL
jgi:hypothetical protein